MARARRTPDGAHRVGPVACADLHTAGGRFRFVRKKSRPKDDHPASAPGLTNVRVLVHPLVAAKMTRLRDRRTGSAEFRAVLHDLAAFLLVEATRDLAVTPLAVRTPYEKAGGYALAKPVVVVPVLRAGLGLSEGILALLPDAKVGHVGIRRNEKTFEPEPYYAKVPVEAREGTVLVVDPMLATGGTAVHAVSLLKARGCRSIRLLSVVAAPEGARRMAAAHPDVPVFVCALDRRLDRHARIRPGLGDAGDRLFGTDRVL